MLKVHQSHLVIKYIVNVMSIASVTCISNVYLSYLVPWVYNNSNLCVLGVALQRWRLNNKHTYIHKISLQMQSM